VPLLRAAQRRYPNDFWLSLDLGSTLLDAKQYEEAVGYYRVAVALRPDAATAHNNLGVALKYNKDLEGAVAAFRRAIALDPESASTHNNLGAALHDKGDLDAAIREVQKAIALDPKSAKAHYNLGSALHDKQDLDGAIRELQKAIALDPRYALSHYNLGIALYDNKDLDGAIAAFRRAIDIDPKLAGAHNNLGVALHDKGDLGGAITEHRRAIALDPKDAAAHTGLGNALYDKQDLAGAIAAYRRAIDIDPNLAYAHGGLGRALLQQGRFAEARTEFRRSLELLPARDPWRQFNSQQLQECERLLAADEKLSAVLRGEAEPAGAAERLALGQLCQYKHRHAAAARFYAGAFAADPRPAADLQQQHRYNAACSAALAAAGQGEDAKRLPDKVAVMLRRQALQWLRADLALYVKLAVRDEPAGKQFVREKMRHWQQDADLTSVREKEAIDKLPADEHEAWRALWADVDALLKKVEPKK
jgi:tetratricopeptide (TPR) repeat protein